MMNNKNNLRVFRFYQGLQEHHLDQVVLVYLDHLHFQVLLAFQYLLLDHDLHQLHAHQEVLGVPWVHLFQEVQACFDLHSQVGQQSCFHQGVQVDLEVQENLVFQQDLEDLVNLIYQVFP